jgi:hypothetical protein
MKQKARQLSAEGGKFLQLPPPAEDRGRGLTPVFSPETCCRAAQVLAGTGIESPSPGEGRRARRGWSISKHVGKDTADAGGRRLAEKSSAFHVSPADVISIPS